MRRRGTQVFVAAGDAPGQIMGYYSLSAASFEKEELPADLAKRLPHSPVPAAVLGRPAIDLTCRGRGPGERLLLDAAHRVQLANAVIAVYASVVDAKNERARNFYEGDYIPQSHFIDRVGEGGYGAVANREGGRWYGRRPARLTGGNKSRQALQAVPRR